MSDFTRRTLRTWAVASAIYAVLLGVAVATLLPWKTPAWNLTLIGYCALHLVAAPGLWRGARWGWRLAVLAAFTGFGLCIAVTAGLVATWAYLRSVFGEFGFGASIGALLFASVALQVLGLVPGLELRALLRREVRADLSAGKGWVRALVGLSLAPLLLGMAVHARYDLDPMEPVGAEGRAEAITHLRAAVEGHVRPNMPALQGVPVGDGPVFVTLWKRGVPHARVTGEGDDLASALSRAAEALARHDKVKGRKLKGTRIKIDRIVDAVPVPFDAPPVVSLSVNPGLDGLRRVSDSAERTLLPDDLLKRGVFGAAPLIPGIRELRLGLDARKVLDRLGLRDARLERIRTESWIEHEDAVLPVDRGNTPLGTTGPEAWRHAAIEGGDFILRQIREDGRFHYQYFPLSGRHSGGDAYSLPRHSGTIYALALLYGRTELDRFKTGAERAIAWLDQQMPESCGAPERTCVVKGRKADLGSAALTLVGMLEYQRQTKDPRYEPTMRRLLEFVLFLQRADGDFHHVYTPDARAISPDDRRLFYSEEAALALVMAHEVLGDARYLEAAEHALDYLTGPKYERYFLGGFIYGADHWTCIAADEAWPRLKKKRYLDFCTEYADFIRRLQYDEGWSNDDFTGHYGYGALMVPQAAAAGFTEAVISAFDLSRKHGTPDADILRQAEIALDALAREQVRPANAWLMPDPAAARGAIRRSLVEQEVRIDFTQHAASALIRGVSMQSDRNPPPEG